MKKVKEKNNELKAYRIGPFTMLQLMTLLAIGGLLFTWILYQIF